MSTFRPWPLARGFCLAFTAFVPLAVQSADFTVTKTADTADGVCDTDCSLREAVIAANLSPGADTIRLRHPLYRLTLAADGDEDDAVSGDLDLKDEVLIRGLSARSTIDAGARSRIFEIMLDVTAELADLTLRNGQDTDGGGIDNAGSLTLRRVWVDHNRATGEPGRAPRGGGIRNTRELRLLLCRIQGNTALNADTLIGGTGGGIFSDALGHVFMYDTIVRYNVTGLDDATGTGAGLYSLGAARIERSYFGHNDAGDGEGSAIAMRRIGSLYLANSTVSGNGHDGADAAIAVGTMTPGERQPKAHLFNVTLTNNNGGGLLNTGRTSLRNTLIGGNYTQDGNDRWYDTGRNCRTALGGSTTQSYSLLGADGNCPAAMVTDNRIFMQEILAPLGYFEGPTPVHPLRPSSYTVDAGDPSVCPERDQLGAPRPVDGDGNGSALCDLGAVERVVGG